MHVEVDHRDTVKPVDSPGASGADRDIVEEAETHGAFGLGVVPGRPDRTEGIPGLARDHRIDRGNRGAGGAQRRLARAWREDGIGVDAGIAALGNRGQHGLYEVAGVDAGNVLEVRRRGLPPVEMLEFGCLESRQDSTKPSRGFRVKFPGVMP